MSLSKTYNLALTLDSMVFSTSLERKEEFSLVGYGASEVLLCDSKLFRQE